MKRPDVILEALRTLLGMQIRLDIGRAVHEHPHLTAEEANEVLANLTARPAIDRMIGELAREEIEEAIARGEPPAPALIELAGYNRNDVLEG